MRRIARVACGVIVAAAVMAVRSVGAQAPAEELRKPYSELSARPMWASKVKGRWLYKARYVGLSEPPAGWQE